MQKLNSRTQICSKVQNKIKILVLAILKCINAFKIVICIIELVHGDLLIINKTDFIKKIKFYKVWMEIGSIIVKIILHIIYETLSLFLKIYDS